MSVSDWNNEDKEIDSCSRDSAMERHFWFSVNAINGI